MLCLSHLTKIKLSPYNIHDEKEAVKSIMIYFMLEFIYLFIFYIDLLVISLLEMLQ